MQKNLLATFLKRLLCVKYFTHSLLLNIIKVLTKDMGVFGLVTIFLKLLSLEKTGPF